MKTIWKTMATVLLSLVIAIGTGCKKETPENNGNNNDNGGDNTTTEEVRVTTYTPQDISANTAVCGGDVIVTQGLALSEIGVCWSTSSNPTTEGPHLSTANWSEPYVCTITGLVPNTEYHVRAYALRGLICYYGEEKTFTTQASGVEVTTYMPQSITSTTAICGGDVVVTPGLTMTELGVCWSTNSHPTAEDIHLSTSDWNEPFICTLTELEPATRYYVRAYALRGLECYYGAEKSFTTEDSGVEVNTYTPQSVTATTAVCGGNVVVTPGVEVAELGVCWSTSNNPTVDDFLLSTQNWNEPFVCTLTELIPNTEYYVRAYVLCGMEYYYGDEKTFTTETQVATPPTISVFQEYGYIQDGDVLDIDTEYQFGFTVSSETGLASLRIVVDESYEYNNLDLSGLNSFTYSGVITYSLSKAFKEIIGESVIKAVVTDIDGRTNSASIRVSINQPPAQPLETVGFIWHRLGSISDGLDEFGLIWEGSYPRGIYARIVPMEGVTLFIFNPEVWYTVTTDIEKVALFVNAMETQTPANEYFNVAVDMASMVYDDVIGTIMPDGTMHLMHVTNSTSQYISAQGMEITITGEAK